MPIIHFLNVEEGDCTIIEHASGRKTVIDVCNARSSEKLVEAATQKSLPGASSVKGNFNQKDHPVNPISYLKERGIDSVFRYIQSHPDMDHMDGIKDLFAEFCPLNFWDTANTKQMEGSWGASRFRREDWEYYKSLRDRNLDDAPKRLTLTSGDRGRLFNKSSDGSNGGDGLSILAPTEELVSDANRSNEFNDCSYVILYRTCGYRIVFAGDSHNATWEHILGNHKEEVRNVDLFVAPHHGRDSSRSFKFLDVLNPKLTLFGVGPSEHLAYSAWNKRSLEFMTNNQASCVVIEVEDDLMNVYVTNENFAMAKNKGTYFKRGLNAWYVTSVGSD